MAKKSARSGAPPDGGRLTATQIAEELGCSAQLVRRWADPQRFDEPCPHVLDGRRKLYRLREVLAWREKHLSGPNKGGGRSAAGSNAQDRDERLAGTRALAGALSGASPRSARGPSPGPLADAAIGGGVGGVGGEIDDELLNGIGTGAVRRLSALTPRELEAKKSTEQLIKLRIERLLALGVCVLTDDVRVQYARVCSQTQASLTAACAEAASKLVERGMVAHSDRSGAEELIRGLVDRALSSLVEASSGPIGETEEDSNGEDDGNGEDGSDAASGGGGAGLHQPHAP